MSSKIQWTGERWNPVTGCTKVSPGCSYCYAERTDFRWRHDSESGRPWDRPASQGGRGVTLHPERLGDPLHMKKPRRIFVNSMSDPFHEDVPPYYVASIFAIMAMAPQHTFPLLTKRPERARALMTDDMPYAMERALREGPEPVQGPNMDLVGRTWPLENVEFGTSAETQYWADIRVPILGDIPAWLRWVSVEPQLELVNLMPYLTPKRQIMSSEHTGDVLGSWACEGDGDGERILDWVVAGGESGGPARRSLVFTDGNYVAPHPQKEGWVRHLRDQCVYTGVPFFFKQWGGPYNTSGGRLLDGREWNELAERRAVPA